MWPWDESVWFVEQLLTDPASHLLAELQGWEHPFTREWILLAQIADATTAPVVKGRPKPWPRPWKPKARRGRTDLAPDKAKEILARLAGREVPDRGR